MGWRTLRNLLLLAVLFAAAGWWMYAGSPGEADPTGGPADKPTVSETDTAAAESQPSAADESLPAEPGASKRAEPANSGSATAVADDGVPAQAASATDGSAGEPLPVAAPTPTPRAAPKRGIAEVLEGVDYSIPGERERVVAELKAIEEADRMAAVARAQELGIPVRRELPDGRVQEVAGLDERGQLLFRITHNVSAGISTAANLVQAAPYNLTGTNILAGVWDGGSVRSAHQEFGGRVTVRDGSGANNHATHVGGTIAAAGVSANAKGMATAARIDSYDWNSDISEMNAAGAALATETNKLLVSNHSYGYISGWDYVNGGTPYRAWEWYGNGTTSSGFEQDFGRYNTFARSTDLAAVAMPFFTIFWSAGNDRNDDPANGASVALSPGSSTVVSYSSSSHPGGDGTYRGGYENIGYNSVAKNIVTIGAVNDAVSNGQRSTNNATMSSFSSWGPTDDGRIKPDLVANGVDLFSSGSASDIAYYWSSGTSMSSPNAAGSAVLVAQQYVQLFGQAMRSSTMRGLLIHTADDLGTAGPDYSNGWGLINTKAAVDLVRDHAESPGKVRLTEGLITTDNQTITHSFTWDGVSPIKATLAWTDPAGASTTTSDFRAARLVNNLDLRVVGPNGVTNRPYVMPFVGTWTQASMSQPATSGTNNTDNVEQVYIASPSAAGTYQVVVTYQGTLTNSQQHYSLLISGSDVVRPTISDIANQTVAVGTASGPLAFTVGHAEVPASSLTASASSSNLTLVPQSNIVLGGAGSDRTITVTTASGVTGSATITVTVSDGTNTASDSFDLTVNAVPDIALEEVRGSDSSSAAIYNDAVFIGRNGGTGLGAWSGSAAGAGGNYIGVTSVRARSFAVYAGASGAGNTAQATRALGAPLAVGETFGVQLGYTGIATGGEIGMRFFSGGAFRLGLKFVGDTDQWVLNDGGGDIGTGIAWAGGSPSGGTPLQVLLRRNEGNGYSLMLISGGRSYAGVGLVAVSGVMSIDSVQFYSTGQGANEHLGFDELNRALDVAVTDAFELPSAAVGTSGAVKSFILRNDGGATLTSLAATKSGAHPEDYDIVGTIPASLTGGASVTFGLALTPTAVGSRSATFSVASNDPDESSIGFGVSGIGTKGTATVVLEELSQTFDGTPRSVSVTTTPAGLTTEVTYNGSATPPTNAGTYTVVATVTDTNYDGTATETLTIGKAMAGVIFDNLSQTYDGTARSVSVVTTPAGLAAAVTYNGSAFAPVNAGTYTVIATVSDANYQGSATNSLTVGQATPTVIAAPSATAITYGQTLASSALTGGVASVPGSFAFTTPSTAPVAGSSSQSITFTPTDSANYTSVATNATVTVNKAVAAVALGNLNTSFDGEPKPVTVTTDPEGLTVNVTYDGSAAPPTEAGSYAVVATIDDANYAGSASGTLVIDDNLPTFEQWIGQFEGLSDVTPGGDPDGDGLRNAEEYFMALDPTVSDAAMALVGGIGFDGVYLEYRRSKQIRDVTGTVKWSTQPGGAEGWTHDSVNDVQLQDHETWELRRASVPWLEGAERIFLRLDLTME